MSSVLCYNKLNIAVLAPTKTILKTCPRGSNDARATIGIAATTASTTRFYNSTTSKSNSNNNNSSNTNTTNDHKLLGPIVHKGYTNSKFKYFRGWAYQQVYLNRRINYKRNQKSATAEVATQEPIIAAHHDHDHNHDHDDRDRILFFEHESVYTLGRGAKESHITFLNQEEKELLSRTNRTTNASRLYVDKFVSKPIINSVASSVPPSTVSSLVEEEVNSMDEPTAVTAPNGAPIYRIERGGEVTYHGPGQLVCYPLLDLTNNPPYKQDLHWYLNCIEEVIIQTLSEYNIVGERDDINTGVWVGGNKIAAVGVSSSRWITTHGFALNITSDLEYFDTSLIIPCGIEGRGVTSIVEVLKERNSSSSEEDGSGHGNECVPHIDDVADVIIDKFQNVFNVKVEKGSILR